MSLEPVASSLQQKGDRARVKSGKLQAGFSLIELLVVTAIFVILSGVVLANNSRFGNRIVLQNLAHDIALSIREAQIYGIAVKRYGVDQFNTGFGMHFAPGSGYELFADVNKNGIWDAGETVKATSIAAGYQISDICAPDSTCGATRLDVLFRRPEPDACISTNGTVTLNDQQICMSSLTRATITITSNRDDRATIVVESSGQISVQ